MRGFFLSMLVVTAPLAFGCASQPAAAPSTTVRKTVTLEEVRAASHDTLRELAAADGRVAQRAHVEIDQADLARAMQASLATEESAALLSGTPDAFTRAPRARAFAAAHARLDGLAPVDPAARTELAALRAVLREEEARFGREATLPAAATRLVRALASVEPPRTTAERTQNDVVLARRLGEIEDSLDDADSLDGDAIEDALDELEPFVGTVYPEAEKALTSLRLACGQALPAPHGPRRIPALAVTIGAGTKARWIELRARVRTEREAYQTPDESVHSADREAQATDLLLQRGPCPAAPAPARVSPAPERAFGCAALERGAGAPLLLDLVVHDLLTVGLWAIELGEERAGYRRVLSQYAMAGRVSTEVGSKLARRAAAEPETALRAGLIGQELAALDRPARAQWIRDYLARGAFLAAELAP